MNNLTSHSKKKKKERGENWSHSRFLRIQAPVILCKSLGSTNTLFPFHIYICFFNTSQSVVLNDVRFQVYSPWTWGRRGQELCYMKLQNNWIAFTGNHYNLSIILLYRTTEIFLAEISRAAPRLQEHTPHAAPFYFILFFLFPLAMKHYYSFISCGANEELWMCKCGYTVPLDLQFVCLGSIVQGFQQLIWWVLTNIWGRLCWMVQPFCHFLPLNIRETTPYADRS